MKTKYARICMILLLSSCGGAGSSTGETVVTAPAGTPVTVAPTPTPTPAATSTPIATGPCPAATGSFRSFDFKSGMAFPQLAEARVEAATYDAASGVVNVPVVLDRPTPVTVILRVGTVDGSARAGVDFQWSNRWVVFRPGDPLRQTVTIPVLKHVEGRSFSFQINQINGATGANNAASISASNSATAFESITDCRRPGRTFAATGTLAYSLDRSSFAMSDLGSANAWATSLSYGRERFANEETGLYVDSTLPAFRNLDPTFRWTDEGLVLHTEQFATPVVYNGSTYRQSAAMLDGRKLQDARVTYGQYEWVAKLPDRAGSWPAFWLKTDRGWPPEIDVFEGFNYQSWWKPDTFISSTIHGGEAGKRAFMNGVVADAEGLFGIRGLTTGFHRYAVDIQPDFITTFVDGIEVNQVVNPFPGETWYPLMDVAVRAPGDYSGGSGDMVVRNFRAWRN